MDIQLKSVYILKEGKRFFKKAVCSFLRLCGRFCFGFAVVPVNALPGKIFEERCDTAIV